MAWANSDRRARLPADWPRIRRRILRRDKHACTNRFSDGGTCGRPATEVDHIAAGDDHTDANLRALCAPCHRRKSSSEGGTASAAHLVSEKRPARPHPALED